MCAPACLRVPAGACACSCVPACVCVPESVPARAGTCLRCMRVPVLVVLVGLCLGLRVEHHGPHVPVCVARNLATHALASSADRRTRGAASRAGCSTACPRARLPGSKCPDHVRRHGFAARISALPQAPLPVIAMPAKSKKQIAGPPQFIGFTCLRTNEICVDLYQKWTWHGPQW